MLKVTYTYSFLDLSGKPKRFIESKPECTLKGYGVSMDTVTLCVLYDSDLSFEIIGKQLLNKFKLKPSQVKYI